MSKEKSTLLLYHIADTFQMVLTCPDNFTVRGSKKLKLQVGDLELKSDMLVVSDFVNLYSIGVLVKVRKKLWAYMISEPAKLKLWFFDSEKVNLRTDEAEFFVTGREDSTLRRLAPGIVQSFTFNNTKHRWVPDEEASGVDEGQPQQGFFPPVPHYGT